MEQVKAFMQLPEIFRYSAELGVIKEEQEYTFYNNQHICFYCFNCSNPCQGWDVYGRSDICQYF